MATYKLEILKGPTMFREVISDSATGILSTQTLPVVISTPEAKDFLHMLDTLTAYAVTHNVQKVEFTEQ